MSGAGNGQPGTGNREAATAHRAPRGGARLVWWGSCVAVLVVSASAAWAQEPVAVTAPLAPRVEIVVLGGVFGGAELGETPATVLTNQVPTSGQTSLFTTRTSITQAPLVEGRLGVRLTRAIWVEAGASYAQPDFAVDLSGDVEGAPDVTATSTLTQVTADAALQYRWRGRRVSPFVMAGGGYLRQLDEPRTTVETGGLFYGGGGVIVRLSTASRGWLARLALRGDVRAVWLRGGITLEDERGPALVASGGLVFGL